MHSKKKIAAIALVLALSVNILSGCGGKNTEQRYAFPLGTASPEDTVTQIYAEKFAEEVLKLSAGRIKIQVYPNSVLGGDRELLESCKDGDIPFVVQNTAPQVTFMSDLAVFDLPCVFDSLDECRQTIDDQAFYSEISDVYTQGGYHLLGIADQGFRIMSSNKPVNSFADFKGQKIRTMENSFHLSFWQSLKANPAPMSFSEVYIGLQQHTIDAQENPYEVIVSNKLYEQQDYMIETNHLPHLITLIVNDEFFKDFPEEDQEIIAKAARIACEYARQESDRRISDRKAIITKNGSTVIELSPEIRNEIRQAASEVYSDIEQNISPSLYKAYTSQ